MIECRKCGFWDCDCEACTCPAEDLWYACPIQTVDKDVEPAGNEKILKEYITTMMVNPRNEKFVKSRDGGELIRCRYCAFWQDNNHGYPHPDCKWTFGETPDADDYCSGAEKLYPQRKWLYEYEEENK